MSWLRAYASWIDSYECETGSPRKTTRADACPMARPKYRTDAHAKMTRAPTCLDGWARVAEACADDEDSCAPFEDTCAPLPDSLAPLQVTYADDKDT